MIQDCPIVHFCRKACIVVGLSVHTAMIDVGLTFFFIRARLATSTRWSAVAQTPVSSSSLRTTGNLDTSATMQLYILRF